jgi:hypothetical protein
MLEEWENAYSCGAELVQEAKPQMLSSLNAIYNNPSQFAGYYLRGIIEGNLLMNGDAAAEQNHLGVVAYLGQGATYSVAEQIIHLLNQQKGHVRPRYNLGNVGNKYLHPLSQIGNTIPLSDHIAYQ